MQSVKARRQGNATVVTLPSALRIPEGSEFYIIALEDGSIQLIPKIANPYTAASEQNVFLWQEDEWQDAKLEGREVL